MSFEELQKIWATQPASAAHPADEPELLRRLKADSEEFDRRIGRRDRREITVGVFLLLFFAAEIPFGRGPAWAHALTLGLAGFVTAVLAIVRWRLAERRQTFDAFTVTRDESRLMVQLTGQPRVQVFASAPDEFFYKIVAASLSFERNAHGKVVALVLHQNGLDQRAVKQ